MTEQPRVRLARPLIGEAEEQALLTVLRSGMLVQGAMVARFEAGLGQATTRKHAVAVTNGTSALRLSLSALGVSRGDDVLCPNLTWPSPAHAILELGAVPVLVDVDASTWNVSPEAMASARTPRTVAAIVIDQFGNPAPTPEIAAALPGVAIVVDAACSLGSRLQGAPAGSFGDIACMSFHPRKVLTTGEGGACLTDSQALAERLRVLRNHGQSAPGNFVEASGNYRLGEFAAALGCVQLERLDTILEERRRLAARYRDALPKALHMQNGVEGAEPNHQTLGVLLPNACSTQDRDRIVSALSEAGVESGRLSFALHALPQLQNAKRVGDYAVSTAIADRGFSLPLYPGMTDDEQQRVLDAMGALVGEMS